MKLPFLPFWSAQNFGQRPAIISPRETISFNRLLRHIQTAVRALEHSGLDMGDRLAVEARPNIQVIGLLWAAMAKGIITVLMNPGLPQQTFDEQLNDLGCRLAYVSSQRILPAGVSKFDWPAKVEASKQENQRLPGTVSGDQPATIIFTSGSSGRPRAVLHAYRNHYFCALGSNRNIPLRPGDRWMLSLPLFHVAGIAILFRAFLAGAAVVLPDSEHRLGENILHFEPTHLSLVATQLGDLLGNAQTDRVLKKSKAMLMGGSAIPEKLLTEAFRRGWPLVLSYGSSEMSSQITATVPGAPFAEWKTSGRLLPFRELQIDRSGQIRVKGKTLFLGYWRGNRIELPLDAHGWFSTGDLGRIDAQGRLIVYGRKDRMFISGGENIYPEEIERALERTGGIKRVVVVPVKHERFGWRPVAFVSRWDQLPPDEEKLKASLRTVLPGFKIPLRILPWPQDAPTGMKIDLQWFRQKAEDCLQTKG